VVTHPHKQLHHPTFAESNCNLRDITTMNTQILPQLYHIVKLSVCVGKMTIGTPFSYLDYMPMVVSTAIRPHSNGLPET